MIWEVLPIALEDSVAVPPILVRLVLTLETTPELLICLDRIGMLGALESASKLLPSEEPCTIALPAILERFVLMLARFQTTWLLTGALPQPLFTSTLTFEPMEAPGPTI